MLVKELMLPATVLAKVLVPELVLVICNQKKKEMQTCYTRGFVKKNINPVCFFVCCCLCFSRQRKKRKTTNLLKDTSVDFPLGLC